MTYISNHTTNHTTTATGNYFVAPELLEHTSIARLLAKHNQLEEQLHAELNHPHINWDGVKLIKRRKLAVTEQLAKLRHVHSMH
jgi:hypothetical protein